MKHLPLWTLAAAFALTGCEHSPLEADYGRSVRLMSENQVYDHRTLINPSLAAVEGGDPDMLNAAVATMRSYAVDRKEVSKPVLISIAGQGAQ